MIFVSRPMKTEQPSTDCARTVTTFFVPMNLSGQALLHRLWLGPAKNKKMVLLLLIRIFDMTNWFHSLDKSKYVCTFSLILSPSLKLAQPRRFCIAYIHMCSPLAAGWPDCSLSSTTVIVDTHSHSRHKYASIKFFLNFLTTFRMHAWCSCRCCKAARVLGYSGATIE